MKETHNNLMRIWYGLIFAIVIGASAYIISVMTLSPIADPLLVAMILGIIIRSIIGDNAKFKSGFSYAMRIFLPR